jgi:hypothetical protein
MINRFYRISDIAVIRVNHHLFYSKAFSHLVKPLTNPHSNQSDAHDLTKLKESYEKKDIKSFDKEFRAFTSQLRKMNQKISIPTRLHLTSMISSLGNNQLKQNNYLIPSMLRSMAYCGYSMTSRVKDETSLISTLEKAYLQNSEFGFVDDILLFLTAISKLRFTWQTEHFLKAEIILLIDKIKNEKMTSRQFEEFITSIVMLRIPWKELTTGSQESIIQKMIKLQNHLDAISMRSFLKSFASFEGIRLKEMPLVSKVFLSMTTEALELKGLEIREKEWGRQVTTTIYSFTLHSFILCVFAYLVRVIGGYRSGCSCESWLCCTGSDSLYEIVNPFFC